MQEEPVDIVEVVEIDVCVIDEHQISDVPITTKAPVAKESAKKEQEAEEVEEKIETEEILEEVAYDIYTMEVVHAALEEQAYEATQIVDVTEVIIPIDETQTVVAYNKKEKYSWPLSAIK